MDKQMSELDSMIQDSIAVVGLEETVAILWDQYLSQYPADPALAAALSALDPHMQCL